jgi:hypothetical protein
VRRRHDPFLKLLYREGARDAVTLFFPALAARIDWARLEWTEKEVPIRSPRPRTVVADLVGRTRDVEGRYLEVLIHPEIQMQPDEEMDWRVLQYNAGLLLQEENPKARVLTFVFYHCPGGGETQKRLHQLEFYGEMTLAVGYWSVGLGELDAEPYAASDNPMAWALASWMRQPRIGRVELRLRLLDKILRFGQDEWYRQLLMDAIQSYFRLDAREQQEERQLLRSEAYAEVDEMLQTELSKRDQATERRVLQNALLTVVRSRFSTVPAGIEERVRRERSLATLDRLIQRAATAATLDDIWPSGSS